MARSQAHEEYGVFWPEGQDRESHAVHGCLKIDSDDRTMLELFTRTTGTGDPKQWIVDQDTINERLRIVGETALPDKKWMILDARRIGDPADPIVGLPSPQARVIRSIYASEHAISWWALRDTLPNDIRGVQIDIDNLNAFLVPFASLQQVTSKDDSIQLKVDRSPKLYAVPVPGCEITIEHDLGLPIKHHPDGSIALARDPVIRIRFDTAVTWQTIEMIANGLLAFFRVALWHPVQIRKFLTVDPQPNDSISFTHLPWPGPQHHVPDPMKLSNDVVGVDINHHRALFREIDLNDDFSIAISRWFECYQKARAAIEFFLLGAFRSDNRPEDTVLYLVRSLERIGRDLSFSTKGNLEGKLTDIMKYFHSAFKDKVARTRLKNSAIATRDWYTHRDLHANQSRRKFIMTNSDELDRLNGELLILLKMILIEQISADRDFAIETALRHQRR